MIHTDVIGEDAAVGVAAGRLPREGGAVRLLPRVA